MATKPLKDYAARGPFDDIDTPWSATEYLIPSLHHLIDEPEYEMPVIWEAAPPLDRPSKLADHLIRKGFPVMSYPGEDFFSFEPDPPYQVLVTNPPFSIKEAWVQRTYALGRKNDIPWALLMPIAALGVRRSRLNIMLSECQIILPPRRVDFTGKKSPWQYVAWYTWGFDLPGGNLIPVNDNGVAEWA